MSETTTTTTEQQSVKLWARCEAAELDVKTGEVTLNPHVETKWLVQDLVREIQVLTQQLADLKKRVEEKTETVTEKL